MLTINQTRMGCGCVWNMSTGDFDVITPSCMHDHDHPARVHDVTPAILQICFTDGDCITFQFEQEWNTWWTATSGIVVQKHDSTWVLYPWWNIKSYGTCDHDISKIK
jgi:hypothetical protein